MENFIVRRGLLKKGTLDERSAGYDDRKVTPLGIGKAFGKETESGELPSKQKVQLGCYTLNSQFMPGELVVSVS